ncbi:MAG: hypothetical protein P2A85_13690 [Microcoleus anatoxicus]|uniref:hypothetical protein n=1 Tax=Microcoleus anatoxicus TaxID=2705319 RepID=UPI0036732458
MDRFCAKSEAQGRLCLGGGFVADRALGATTYREPVEIQYITAANHCQERL